MRNKVASWILIAGTCAILICIVLLQLEVKRESPGDSETAQSFDEQVSTEISRAPAQAARTVEPKKEERTPEKKPSETNHANAKGSPQREPERPSKEEIERENRRREEIVRSHISTEFMTDEGLPIHWLDGISTALSEQTLPDGVNVLFKHNGMIFFETRPGSPPPLGQSTVYQAVYDAKRNRVGVATGIVVIANDLNLDPVQLGSYAGVRHSSSRYETGIHFFNLPEGGVAAAGAAVEKLKSVKGVYKAQLATRFEEIVGL